MRKKRKAMAEKHQWKPVSRANLRAFIDKVKAVPLSEQPFILPKANNVPEKTGAEPEQSVRKPNIVTRKGEIVP